MKNSQDDKSNHNKDEEKMKKDEAFVESIEKKRYRYYNKKHLIKQSKTLFYTKYLDWRVNI